MVYGFSNLFSRLVENAPELFAEIERDLRDGKIMAIARTAAWLETFTPPSREQVAELLVAAVERTEVARREQFLDDAAFLRATIVEAASADDLEDALAILRTALEVFSRQDARYDDIVGLSDLACR